MFVFKSHCSTRPDNSFWKRTRPTSQYKNRKVELQSVYNVSPFFNVQCAETTWPHEDKRHTKWRQMSPLRGKTMTIWHINPWIANCRLAPVNALKIFFHGLTFWGLVVWALKRAKFSNSSNEGNWSRAVVSYCHEYSWSRYWLKMLLVCLYILGHNCLHLTF